MSDINSVSIVGRLTKDGELKYTNTGTPVIKMNLAVNKSVKKNDQWTEQAGFFEVVIWGKRAESLAQYLTKGCQIGVLGELEFQQWEQDGQKRSKVLINANNIQLLGSKNNSQSSPQASQKSYPNNANFEDDLIPF